MANTFKRILGFLLIIMIAAGLFSSLPIVASASSLASGNCDPDNSGAVKYDIYNDNILVISGNGPMKNFAEDATDSTAPWADFYFYTNMAFMQKIVIANGVTTVGDYAFHMGENSSRNYIVNLINLPDSLLTIGAHAFCYERKIETITIPRNVTSIGDYAFEGCEKLKTINCYAEPSTLQWDISKSFLSGGCDIHVMANQLDNYIRCFPDYESKFVGDLIEPTNIVPEGKNILVSYDDSSQNILAGAAPYSVKAVNSKGTWPITFGARGFVTCVKVGNDYYALTNNSTGTLKKLVTDSTSGKATATTDEVYSDRLSLRISHEYIGANSVKIIYTVKNKTGSTLNFSLGSSGDIKIALDDYAAIHPLVDSSSDQIGITMTSTKEYDIIDSKAPTLGFAAKNIGGSAADAKVFYGEVNANMSSAATAVKSDIFIPARIFTKNPDKSQEEGEFSGKDSGLSFVWENIELAANKEKQFSVIFSVPNAAANEENQTVINEVKSNLKTNNTGYYAASDGKQIYFNNEVVPRADDILAKSPNNFSSLKNFLLLGVQRKTEMTTRNCIRFVSVVNTDILRDAKEYGYIIAKIGTSSMNYVTARSMIGQVTYESPNIYKENIKGTDNKISGSYGIYEDDTPYKYITLGINDVPDDVVFMARFYVVDNNDHITYADYYNSGNTRFDGCAADWGAITNQVLIGS